MPQTTHTNDPKHMIPMNIDMICGGPQGPFCCTLVTADQVRESDTGMTICWTDSYDIQITNLLTVGVNCLKSYPCSIVAKLFKFQHK